MQKHNYPNVIAPLPVEFMRSISKLDHFDPEAFLAVHGSGEQLVSVHMNPDKSIYKEGKWNADIPEPPFEFSRSYPGLRMPFIFRKDLSLRSILFFMPAIITYRKLPECFWRML